MSSARKEDKYVTTNFLEDDDDFVFVSGEDCLDHDGEPSIPEDGMNTGTTAFSTGCPSESPRSREDCLDHDGEPFIPEDGMSLETTASSTGCPSESPKSRENSTARHSNNRRWERDIKSATRQAKSPPSSGLAPIPANRVSADEANNSTVQRQPLSSFTEYALKEPDYHHGSLRSKAAGVFQDTKSTKRGSTSYRTILETPTSEDQLEKTVQPDDISKEKTDTTEWRTETEGSHLYSLNLTDLNQTDFSEGSMTRDGALSEDDASDTDHDYETDAYCGIDFIIADGEASVYDSYIPRRDWQKKHGLRKKGSKYRHHRFYCGV